MNKKVTGIGITLATVMTVGGLSAIPFVTEANYTKNINAQGEDCSIQSGTKGELQNITLDSPYGYSLEELTKDELMTAGVANGVTIETKTNTGTYFTEIPTFKSSKEAQLWYDANKNLDIGDICTVQTSKDGVKQTASDGYVVRLGLNDNVKLAKFTTGKYSYLKNKYVNASEKWSDNNRYLTITVPGQIVSQEDAKPIVGVKFQRLDSTIRVVKEDDKGQPLIGYTFKLYDSTKKKELGEGTTDIEGKYDFTGVPVGVYYLQETKRDDKLEPSGKYTKVTVKESNVKRIVQVVDDNSGIALDGRESGMEQANDDRINNDVNTGSDSNEYIVPNYDSEDDGLYYGGEIWDSMTDKEKCLYDGSCVEEGEFTKEELEFIKDLEEKSDKVAEENAEAYDRQEQEDEEEMEKFDRENAVPKDEDDNPKGKDSDNITADTDDTQDKPGTQDKDSGKNTGGDDDDESGQKGNPTDNDNTDDISGDSVTGSNVNPSTHDEVDINGTENDVHKPLPQTGEENNKAVGLAGGLLLVFGGLMVFLRRKKDKKDETKQ